MEVMIAQLVHTVGHLAVVALFETGMNALKRGDKISSAAGVAHNKMESLLALNVSWLAYGEDHPEGMTRRWSIHKSDKDARIWIIHVEVVWKNTLNQYQTVSLKSMAFF